uniref:Uncharacterized protein n=1 Tax=Athene cunicularia TaxID=194338 RepID=A0A663LZ99_ATHCN
MNSVSQYEELLTLLQLIHHLHDFVNLSQLFQVVAASFEFRRHLGYFPLNTWSYLCQISPDTSLLTHIWEVLLEFLITVMTFGYLKELWNIYRLADFTLVMVTHDCASELHGSHMGNKQQVSGKQPQEKLYSSIPNLGPWCPSMTIA